MTPSPWLDSYLMGREQFRPTAYLPTKKDVWTIGYGHTHGVKEGDTCTMEQGRAFLDGDVAGAVATVNKLCAQVRLTQPQFDALCSFVFNIGEPNFSGSTMLRHLLDSDYDMAAAEFPKWNKQKGRVLPGLVTRREEERARFLAAE